KHAEDDQPFEFDRMVDLAALCREHQRAVNAAETLYRYGYRYDHFTALVGADHARLHAIERACDFLVTFSVCRPGIGIKRKFAADDPLIDGIPLLLDELCDGSGLCLHGRREIEAQNISACVEGSRVEEERAVPVVNASSGIRRRDEPAQQRCNPL